jgi:polyhydroxyalkanoate synthase subunit PhaC
MNTDTAPGIHAPVTPFEEVFSTGLLRLRRYGSTVTPQGPPVLLVYSLVKQSSLLDLDHERSVVRSLLRRGFSVYLTDWEPPTWLDAWRGLDDYVDHDLAAAVSYVSRREGVDRVSLVGCCFGSVLALLHAAAHPDSVLQLVTVAMPTEVCPPFAAPVIAYLTGAYHNLPAWFVAARLNERVPHRGHVPHFLADELDEPELLEWKASISPLMDAFEAWVRSDVPLAGRLARELASPPPGPYEESPLRIGSRRVDLDAIRCPILTVAGERDRVAPPSGSRTLLERVNKAVHVSFPTGHIGLFLSLAAHDRLWPRISDWLSSTRAEPAHHAA